VKIEFASRNRRRAAKFCGSNWIFVPENLVISRSQASTLKTTGATMVNAEQRPLYVYFLFFFCSSSETGCPKDKVVQMKFSSIDRFAKP
jgi:hypothetical protein